MDFRNFTELVELVKALPKKTTMAVVAAEEKHTLEAVTHAVKEGAVNAILIGDEEKIAEILSELGEKKEDYPIIHAADFDECIQIAVKLVNDGKAGMLMKGKLETSQMMRAVFNKENNLRKGNLISQCGFYECPNYHKIFAATDVAVNTNLDVEKKRHILENAVDILHKVGVAEPKVACLCAVEKVSPKMPETQDAAALKELNQKGEITGCIVEGPISLDLAVVKESAEIKGYDSPVAGDADLLLMPDLAAGNITVKALTELGGCRTAGFITGAKVPIVLLSRAASTTDKYHSIAIAAYAGREQ